LALLILQLRAIGAACEVYDKKSARTALNILNAKPASKKTRALLDEISSTLLRGDFEEAAGLAKNAADGVADGTTT